MGEPEQIDAAGDVIASLSLAPLALVGVLWLIAVTDWALVSTWWWMVLLVGIPVGVASTRFTSFVSIEVSPGRLTSWSWWATVVSWSVSLSLGPSVLWLFVVWFTLGLLIGYPFERLRCPSAGMHWEFLRWFASGLTGLVLAGLVALTLYEHWGGLFPPRSLRFTHLLPALGATLVWILLSEIAWSSPWGHLGRYRGGGLAREKIRLLTVILGRRVLVDPFAIVAAVQTVHSGLIGYLVVVAGLLLADYAIHRLSQASERSQLRSLELERLEQLGRELIGCCLSPQALVQVLQRHVPSMFPYSQIEVRLFPDQVALRHPVGGPPVDASVWEWLRETAQARSFLPGESLPWQEQPARSGLVVAPILDLEREEPVGGIYLRRERHARDIANLLPAVQSLAAQIASALYSEQIYERTLAHQRTAQELALAWQIQKSLLPDTLPQIPGWQLTATLEPARETSGDFYDVIPLADGQFGILVADVADKGMGAALYMTLSRTLIRTYALEYSARPELVIGAANNRILADARASMFVTVFYGVLEPSTGVLTYCNAGHNPPYLFSTRSQRAVHTLPRTGMAMGVLQDAAWEKGVVELAPTDTLVMYTDGITDAENRRGEFFGDARLIEAVWANVGSSVQGVQDGLTAAVREFVGDAPQSDDIALVVAIRGAASRGE